MGEPTISLCMIVKNEEKFLEKCLDSVNSLVDEIIIVDTGSTDRTLDIARKFNSKIFFFEWCHDFAAARNFSLDKSSCNWILVMDADEELSSDSVEEIRRLIKNGDNKSSYYVRVINFLDECDDIGNSTEVGIVRLFPNSRYLRYKRAIHEEIYPQDGEELKRFSSDIIIYHRGYTEKIHKERNKGERNINLLLKSIEKEPDNAFYYYNLGVSYYVQEMLDESIDSLKTAQAKCNYGVRSVYLPSCHSLCAAGLSRRKRYCEAKEQALKAIELSPYFYEAYFNLGKACLGLKEIEEAKEAFLKAIECSDKPQLAVMDKGTGGWKACCELGLIYFEDGKWSEALRYFNKGLEFSSGAIKLLINGAHCYRKMDFFYNAIDCFEKAHKVEPKRLDVYYDLVKLYDKTGLFLEAIEITEEMLDYYPSDKALFYEIAKRYDYSGNYKRAEHYYTQSLIIDDNDGKCYYERARCYWKRGATLKAGKDLKKVKDFNPELLRGLTLYDFMVL